MKIAWGITGAGHYLHESVNIIDDPVKKGIELHLFFSGAGETVLMMYNFLSVLKTLQKQHSNQIKIYYDKDQKPGYPVCAHFNLHYYELLILSPLSANSVGKINVGVADTLITNIFAQMIKGGGEIFAVPCDIKAGQIETEVPGGKKVIIHIDEFNSQNAKNLVKFPHVSVFETPQTMFEALKVKFKL